ncbi:hypothetical protein AKJ16_DCAP17253 [Drosera capensis]
MGANTSSRRMVASLGKLFGGLIWTPSPWIPPPPAPPAAAAFFRYGRWLRVGAGAEGFLPPSGGLGEASASLRLESILVKEASFSGLDGSAGKLKVIFIGGSSDGSAAEAGVSRFSCNSSKLGSPTLSPTFSFIAIFP